MELLYLWINRSENGVFKEQEVLFSDKYKISFNLNELKISISKNESYYNLFENGVISNVTALVGTNGAGKTNLLNYIYGNDIMPKLDEDRAEYAQVKAVEYENSKTIQVFQDGKQVILIHNLGVEIKTSTSVKVISVTGDAFRNMLEEELYLNSVTKIYLTNGNYYDNNGYTSQSGEPSKITLSLGSLRTFTKDFFKKTVRFPQGLIRNNLFNGLQDMIVSQKTVMDFQAICDVLYFNKLFKTEKYAVYAGKISTDLYFSGMLLPVILNKLKYKQPVSYRTTLDYPKLVNEKLELWRNYIQSSKCDIHDLNVCMKLNLIFELDFVFDIFSKIVIVSKPKTVNNLYEACASFLKYNNNEDKEQIEYYKNAISEIDKLEKLLSSCTSITNLYPTTDLAHERNFKIDYASNPKVYLKFINFIDQLARADYSFILKYLIIGNLKMSSGERAYLNFFSWINLLPFFNKITSHTIESTRKNILLLIDEIELYCHPDWQRQFIKFLLEELTLQFSDKKIQVIFATHSPIVLSDIPLSNTVYIKKNSDGVSVIEKRELHRETFASNIYQLFNDAFFLNEKSAIGEYAKFKINEIIKKIKKPLIIDKYHDEIKSIIEIIGEPIIKNKLTSMYQKAFKQSLSLHNDNEVSASTVNIERKKLINLKLRLEKILEEVDESLNRGDL